MFYFRYVRFLMFMGHPHRDVKEAVVKSNVEPWGGGELG